jgi:hypothetical protein
MQAFLLHRTILVEQQCAQHLAAVDLQPAGSG